MTAPMISCITTFFNEGWLLEGAIRSLLNQTYGNFELILVDDGATSETADVVQSFGDPRIRLIQQANDGLSAARNKGLEQVRGEYVCFLDADDSRPFWAFDTIRAVIDNGAPDVIFCRGILSELRGELLPFYDHALLDQAMAILDGDSCIDVRDPRFAKLLPMLQLVEPQSANKVVKTAYLRRYGLCFPNSHFFEDMLFHTACVATANKIALIDDPMFTYYRRYGRPQLTSSNSQIRFDAISVARITLEYFRNTNRSDNTILRAAVLSSVFRLLDWCGNAISHQHRFFFHELMRFVATELDPLYGVVPRQLPGYFAEHLKSLNYVRETMPGAEKYQISLV